MPSSIASTIQCNMEGDLWNGGSVAVYQLWQRGKLALGGVETLFRILILTLALEDSMKAHHSYVYERPGDPF